MTLGELQAIAGPAATSGRCIFVTQALTKTYGADSADVRALRGIDLELFEGEFVVLLGR